MNKLIPSVVTLLVSGMAIAVCLLCQWAPLMTASAVILVLVVSISLYALRGNFGEALLSVIGGLMSIFSFEWTIERYVAFSIAWIAFAFFSIIISSIKIAAKQEEIVRDTALRLVGSGSELSTTEEQLEKIIDGPKLKMHGPIERAKVLRTFVYRGLAIDQLQAALRAAIEISVITRCDFQTVASFVADFFLSFQPKTNREAIRITDLLNDSIRATPVLPEEYFTAFQKSRRLVVSQFLDPKTFLDDIQHCLSLGVPVEEVCHEIQKLHETKTDEKHRASVI